MTNNPISIPADVVALIACTGTRGGKYAPFVEAHSKPQLIYELLRETTGAESPSDAGNQPRAPGSAE